MSVTARMGREYLALGFGFAVAMLDRLAVAGVLLRFWGVESFATWSIGVAAATMVTCFDFGLNFYFPNRIAVAVAMDRGPEARHLLALGNTLMFLAAAIGLAIVLFSLPLLGSHIGAVAITPHIWLATTLLCFPTALRMAITVQVSVYRAHMQFSRQTLLLAILDIIRIFVIVAVAMAGGDLIAVGVVQLLVTCVGVYIILRDLRLRFVLYRLSFGIPRYEELRDMVMICAGYWTQSAPTTLLASLPLFAVSSMVSSATTLSQFALMRTLGNFLRTGVGVLTLGVGQEVGRRIGLGDQNGLRTAYIAGARFFAVQTTSAAGVFLALAYPLFQLWTGKGALFDGALFWVTIAPTLLLPTLALAPSVLAAANRPWPNSIGRMSQLGLSFLLFYLLPIESVPLRMAWGLAVGEALGLGVPITVAMYRLIPAAAVRFHADLLIRGSISICITFVMARAGNGLGSGFAGLIAGILLGGLGAIFTTLILGLGARERQLVWSAMRATSRRLSKRRPFGRIRPPSENRLS